MFLISTSLSGVCPDCCVVSGFSVAADINSNVFDFNFLIWSLSRLLCCVWLQCSRGLRHSRHYSQPNITWFQSDIRLASLYSLSLIHFASFYLYERLSTCSQQVTSVVFTLKFRAVPMIIMVKPLFRAECVDLAVLLSRTKFHFSSSADSVATASKPNAEEKFLRAPCCFAHADCMWFRTGASDVLSRTL